MRYVRITNDKNRQLHVFQDGLVATSVSETNLLRYLLKFEQKRLNDGCQSAKRVSRICCGSSTQKNKKTVKTFFEQFGFSFVTMQISHTKYPLRS